MPSRFLISALVVFISTQSLAETWKCNPVWNFSGMGDRPYSGSGVSETAAKEEARKDCVTHNRGLELDDFCLADPKGNAWNCMKDHSGTDGSDTKG